jgi:hypothetical protein
MECFVPQTQEINPEWSNRPSIHYYNLDEFKQLINGLEDNDARFAYFFSLDSEKQYIPLDAGRDFRELKIQLTVL